MNKDLETVFLNALDDSKDKLYRLCNAYAENPEDAKDLFQEVLVNVWKALPSFKNNSTLSTWMYRITLNVALRHREKLQSRKGRVSKLRSVTIEHIDHLDEQNDNIKKLRLLRECIKSLNQVDKAMITLYLEQLPYKDISTITGLKENTIAVRIKRIKKRLLHCINERL